MLPKEYLEQSKLTARTDIDDDFAFWALGIAGESGELVDMIKKAVYHGHPITSRDLKSELGDLMWYIAGMCRTMNISLEEVMEYNILKLRTRYPHGFSSEASKARVDVNAKVNQNGHPNNTSGPSS